VTEVHNGIESLDHPVIAVNDLGAARDVYERLGFTVPPRGSHIEWGTGNLCIMFADDYVEMRGIIDPGRFLMHLDEHLERFGEGLMGVAFRTDNIARSFSDMTSAGIETDPPRHLTRNFELEEGWTQPSFEICVPAADAIEGLMHVVVLQHLTPELIRRPDYLRHENTAVGVNSMSGIVIDIARVSTKMKRLFGTEAVQVTQSGVHITLPTGQVVHLLLQQDVESTFDDCDALDDKPILCAMTIRVGNLAAAKALLAARHVDFVNVDQQTIRIAPAETCGVLLDFTEAAPS